LVIFQNNQNYFSGKNQNIFTGLDADDLMAEGSTDEFGEFSLSGDETETFRITPLVKISHNCNNEKEVSNSSSGTTGSIVVGTVVIGVVEAVLG